jgi:hypothetical protein
MKLVFGGDIAPVRRYEEIFAKNEQQVFNDIITYCEAEKVDFSIVNLECPLTNATLKIHKSGPGIKAASNVLAQLKSFDVMTLSNNHINDFGEQGIVDTLKHLDDNQISYVGVTHENEIKPIKLTKNGLVSYIFSVSEQEFNYGDAGIGASPLCLLRLTQEINYLKQVAPRSPIIIVVHGGNEFCSVPNPEFRKNCKLLIELGAEAVIGHHSHVVSGIEYYNGKPIIYSLGNLLFDNENVSDDWFLGMLIELCFNVDGTFSEIKPIPLRHSVETPGVKLLSGQEKIKFLEKLDYLSQVLADDERYKQAWHAFSSRQFERSFGRLVMPFWIKGFGFLFDKLKLSRLFLRRNGLLYRLNLIRCPAHRQVIVSELEKRYKEL